MKTYDFSYSYKFLKLLFNRDALGLLKDDFIKSGQGSHSVDDHLKSAMDWLCRAQDSTAGEGVAAGYCIFNKWLPGYPETTGYIIKTFIDYAELTGDERFLLRARELADWEMKIQLADGGYPGGIGVNDYPVVFNTGQILIGMTAIYEATSDERYLESAGRAADWLMSIQDNDGKWTQFTHMSCAHTYHTRVSWPMLEVHALTGNKAVLDSAEANMSWVLRQAKENGWLDYMSMTPGKMPLTHTIAYTLRGMLEGARFLKNLEAELLNHVEKASTCMIDSYNLADNTAEGAPLPGKLSEGWKGKDDYTCLTGNVQMAIIFFKLFQLTGKDVYYKAAQNLNKFVMRAHRMQHRNAGICGAVAGSSPIWGGYKRFNFPNWATKFFADSLMLQKELERISEHVND